MLRYIFSNVITDVSGKSHELYVGNNYCTSSVSNIVVSPAKLLRRERLNCKHMPHAVCTRMWICPVNAVVLQLYSFSLCSQAMLESEQSSSNGCC